jgi:hypothetical protein
MRTNSEIILYQRTLLQYRTDAKATIATAPVGSDVYTEAIKVFLRCDGAIEMLNCDLEHDIGDFSHSPTLAQRQKG